jgi:hypothetical protein
VRRRYLAGAAAVAALLPLALRAQGGRRAWDATETVVLGERPAIEHHLDQRLVDSGEVDFADLFRHGERLFTAKFNALDGQGRPLSTGTGAPRAPGQPAFVRTSGPDSNSCAGCHNDPRTGGAGDFVANVFVLAQARDPVTYSVGPADSNERNSLGMFGAGAIELLAREMTAELTAIRDAAAAEARSSGNAARRALVAKGVSFGSVTVLPDGRVDPTAIEGVDWDLIVKPFHQKGAVISLREFSNNAMNQHHGMQSVERFGLDTDPDGDGVVNELTIGDMTALAVYQAALPVPGRLVPANPLRRHAAERGEAVFASTGCAACHVPALGLRDATFTEPSPLNQPGNLSPRAVPRPFAFDLTREGPGPRLERQGGLVRVEAFTDLKRHDICDAEIDHFANEQLPQGSLAGTAPASAFTVAPPPRPLRAFLTRKLWDAGNSAPYGHRGDCTTLTEAILFHGGEARAARDAFVALGAGDRAAVIEFLKTLQVLPEGAPRVLVERRDGE